MIYNSKIKYIDKTATMEDIVYFISNLYILNESTRGLKFVEAFSPHKLFQLALLLN